VESPDNFEPDDLVRLLKISKVTANRMIQQAIASQTTTQLFKRGHGKEKTNVIDKKALVASCSPPARKKFATNASCTVRKIASSPEMESAAAAAAYSSLGEVRSEHVMHHVGITKATAKRMTKKDDGVKAVKLDELKERLMKKRESRKQATLGTSANANRVKDASTLFSEEERGAHEAWSASASASASAPQIGLEPELADPEGYLASMAETAVFAKEARENLAEQIAEELAKNAADQVSEPTLESVLARIPVRHGGKEHKSIMKMKAATARLAMALQKRKENAQSDEGLTDEEHALPPLQDAPSSSQPRPTASPRKVFNFLMNHNRVVVPNHGSSDGSRLRKHASKIGSALQKLSPKKLFTRTSSKKQSASAHDKNPFGGYSETKVSKTINESTRKWKEAIMPPTTRLVVLESPTLLEFDGLELISNFASDSPPLRSGEKIIEVNGKYMSGEHELFEHLYTAVYPVILKVVGVDASISDV